MKPLRLHVASDANLTAWATACEYARAIGSGGPAHDEATNTYTFPPWTNRYRLELVRDGANGRVWGGFRWAVFACETKEAA